MARRLGITEFYDANEPSIAESRWDDCFIATDDDGYTVYAWVCSDGTTLYNLYVIPELRNKRVASCMISFACGTKVPDIARPWPGHKQRGRLNPYALCRKT